MLHTERSEEGDSTSWLGRLIDTAHGPIDPAIGSQGHVQAADAPVAGPGHALNDMADEISTEGLGAVFDPTGAADRLAARRELAGRFNVVPDGTMGTAGQNQVTREEYERISREYSDIRLGRSDLSLGAKPASMSAADYASFRTSEMSDVGDLLQTESGRGLVGSLAHAPLQADGVSHRNTTIAPRVDAAGHLDPSNSEGGGTFGVSGFAKVAPGMDILPGSDNLRSDVTLYHELTHANRAVYNQWDSGTVGQFNFMGQTINLPGPDTGVGEKEHQAAGLGIHANDEFSENRYRGERREIGGLGIGARNTGAETDANMTHRDQYTYPGHPRTTPAYIP
jgi:hypothetical protein